MQTLTCILIGDMVYVFVLVVLARRVTNHTVRLFVTLIASLLGYIFHGALVFALWELEFYFAQSILEKESLAMNDGANKVFHALIVAPLFAVLCLVASTACVALFPKSNVATDFPRDLLRHGGVNQVTDANPYVPPRT